MSKGDPLNVSDAKSFADTASKLAKETTVLYVSKEEVDVYAAQNTFAGAKPVPGISTMHVMVVDGNTCKLWRLR